MSRIMPLQRKDFDGAGTPRYVIWWLGDVLQEWSASAWQGGGPSEQVRDLGQYACRGVGRSLVFVGLYWNVPLGCVQVESYAETCELRGPALGKRYAHFSTVPKAITYACEEVRRLHRWLESGGAMVLPHPPILESLVPVRPASEIHREIARLEARQAQRVREAGTGSKATIASRKAHSEWDGERLYRLRQEVSVRPV